MQRSGDRSEQAFGLLAFAEGLGGADSVGAVLDRTRSVCRSLFDDPSVSLFEFDAATDSVTRLGPDDAGNRTSTPSGAPLPTRVARSVTEDASARRIDGSTAESSIEGWDPSRRAVVAPIDESRVLCVESTDADGFGDDDVAVVTRIASALAPALERLDSRHGTDIRGFRDTAASDAVALRRLHELTVEGADLDDAIDRLLSLGREHFGLDAAILSHVEGSDYTIEGLVDPSGTYEVGAVFAVEDTMCAVTLAGDATEPLAFHDVTDTKHTSHPASESVRAYIAAPVLVDGDVYGTVNFSSATPRSEPFRPGEQEFVKILAQWIGVAIERHDRIERLERYETIIEAIDDPVYALDTAGRFTFVNEAAKREFGYGSEVIGEHVSIGMDEADIERVREQMGALANGDARSIREQFELDTADGGRTIAETRLARIGDDAFRGTAGVIRDVTEREERRRQLESFQRAIEEAADGVAILEDGEYVYVDGTHVDMYGFDDQTDLLGDTWRKLYDDDEVERLEAEAFPALEERGHWRGKVTGSRPDGTTFPAELSLTIVEDGRLVCTVRDETERLARERDLELKERAMNEASVAIQITDPTRNGNPLVYVNDGFERITGYASEDVLGRNPRLLQGEQTDPEKIAQLREAIDAAEPITLELENVRPDGTSYWARLSVTPVHDEYGELTNYIGIQQDVTDRRELAETLKERTERLELVLSGTGTGIAEWNLETDALTWDDTLVETFGRDPETVDDLLDVVHPDDRERVQTEFETLLDTGDPWNGSFRVRTGSGDVRWLGTRAVPVRENGEPVAVLATGTDVTDRKERTQWLHRLFEHGPLLFVQTRVADGEAVIADCNDSFVTKLGYDRDELIGRPLADLYDEASAAELREAGYEDALDGELTVAERQLVTADGERIPCLLRAVPRDVGGNTVGTDALFIDISDRKASRERYRALLQASPDPVFVADAETGEIVETNAAATRLRGESRAEILGRNQTELHPDGEAELYRTVFEEAIGTDTSITELPDGTQPEFRTADGETVPVEITADTVSLPDGPVIYGVFRDVSDRVERERELELKERAMDEANLGITISDPARPDNPLVYVNDGFVEQTGYDREAALGRNCRFLQGDDGDQPALDDLRDAIAAEEPITVDLRNYRSDGEPFWNRLAVTPVYDEAGSLANYIGIQQDVTEERLREQRLRALHETTRDLLRVDDVAGAVAVANETLLEKFEFHPGSVYLREGDELVHTASGDPTLGPHVERVERGRSPLWDALEAGETIHYEACADIDDDMHRGDVAASAYFPIGDHGVVAVGAEAPDDLRPSRRRLIEMLTGTLAAVLDGLEREESLRTSEQRYRSLAENVPNGAVLTFTADLEYELAAGELLAEFGLAPSDISGADVGSVLADGSHELVPRFRAALDGERTDRRIELGDRTVRIHIVPFDSGRDEASGGRGLVLGQDVTAEAQRERELFEERERFRLLVDSVDEYAFLTLDEDGKVDTWNEGAAALFGYDAETALGMPIDRLHPESDVATGVTERVLKQARVAGESAHEGWRVRADGSEFYADVRYAVLENDDEFQGYATIVRDMTERRRQRQRTEQFVEESDDVVSILDTDGEFSYVSGSADRVLGYDTGELVGRNLFDLVHPDDQERAMESFFGTLDGDTRQARAEWRFRSRDGTWLDVDARCRNKTDDGAIDGVLLYLRDVTDEKERERRFEGIFNQTFQFTGLLDPDGTVLEVNDSTLEFAGVDRDDVIGRPFSDAPWWLDGEPDAIDIADAIDLAAAGEFVRYEVGVNSADGLATVDLSVKPVTDEDGEVRLLVAEGRDITDQQRQRQHLEVMQRVIRHNMRNDLTKVRGWTELMSEEADADTRAEQFETVRRILDSWEGMTEKMKRIRRLSESRKQQLETSRVDSLVDDAVAPVREEYPATSVTVDVSDHGRLRVPSMLGEAVRELAQNAVEARDDATVAVELSRTDAGWIEVAVRDDGPGIPEMEANVLETGDETPLNHGQGLGLWMVHMILTRLGGDISVTSTTDGTTVRLQLPPEVTVDEREDDLVE